MNTKTLKVAVSAVALALGLLSAGQAHAQSRTVATHPRTEAVRDRTPHVRDHSAHPHTNTVVSSRS